MAGMSHLPGGRQHCVIPYGIRVPVAVRLVANCYTQFTFTFYLYHPFQDRKKGGGGNGEKDKGRNEKEQNVKRYGGDGKRREEREWKVAEA